eukprot:jgi/Tetstr1/444660/TSEL_032508.t1
MSICGRRLLLVVLCLAISTPLGSVSGRRLRGVAGGRPSKAGLGEGAAVRNGNCDRYEVAPTVEAPPNDRYEDREWQEWTGTHNDVARRFKDQVGVVFYGDSITLKWNEEPGAFFCRRFSKRDACSERIRPVFEEFFGYPYNAVAFGIAGDTTYDLLQRVTKGEEGRMHAALAVVSIGTNDLDRFWSRQLDFFQHSDIAAQYVAAVVASSVKNIVQEIHRQSCTTKVLLQGLLPRGNKDRSCKECYDRYQTVIKLINKNLLGYSSISPDVDFVDCGDIFLKKKGRNIKEALMPDFLHPSKKGYEALARCLSAKIESLPYFSSLQPADRLAYNFFFDEPMTWVPDSEDGQGDGGDEALFKTSKTALHQHKARP